MASIRPRFLDRLPRSRHNPAKGDIFASHAPTLGWIFGRVIAVNAAYQRWKSVPQDGILLYIFRQYHAEPNPPDRLFVDELLLPPIISVPTLWNRGVVRHLSNRPFELGELLPIHCFEDRSAAGDPKYYDEFANVLPRRVEPCGVLCLVLEAGVDWRVSEASRSLLRDGNLGRAKE